MIILNKASLMKFALLFGILLFQISGVFSQNSILVHKKNSKGYYFLHVNDKIKVITTEDTIKGKISAIKDSLFTINSDGRIVEIPLNKIRFIYFKKNQVIQILIGVPLAIGVGIVSIELLLFGALSGGAYLADPAFFGALLVDLALSGITSCILFHKSKDNIQKDYDIYIIK
jgi:hypothetical protein